MLEWRAVWQEADKQQAMAGAAIDNDALSALVKALTDAIMTSDANNLMFILSVFKIYKKLSSWNFRNSTFKNKKQFVLYTLQRHRE